MDSAGHSFARLILALRDRLDRLVFVGGWAHRLHALHEFSRPISHPPLMTEDADILLERSSSTANGKSLRDDLFRAGFRETLFGSTNPPVTRYELVDDDDGFYAEFLVTQRGGSTDREGHPRPPVSLDGVTAQALPHLHVLGLAPWTVGLTESAGFPSTVSGEIVTIANAATYMAHKVLVLDRRPPQKRRKDILYVYDTLSRFSMALPQLRASWLSVRDAVSARALGLLAERGKRLGTEASDTLRGAQRLAVESGRASPPDLPSMLKVLRLGLEAIFD